MAKELVINGEIKGELTEVLKRKYNRVLAKALIAEYNKENCKRLVEELKREKL
jgi:hypothetical protein